MRAFSLITALALLLSTPGLEAHQAWAAALKGRSGPGQAAPARVLLAAAGMGRGGGVFATPGVFSSAAQGTRGAAAEVHAAAQVPTAPLKGLAPGLERGLGQAGQFPAPESGATARVSARQLAADALHSGAEGLIRVQGDLPRRQVLDVLFSGAKPGSGEGAGQVPAPLEGYRSSGLSPPGAAGADGRAPTEPGGGSSAPGPASDESRLAANRDTLAVGLVGLGFTFLVIAGLSFVLTPAATGGVVVASGLGLASLGASRFFQRPKGDSLRKPVSGPVPAAPGWLQKNLPTLAQLIAYGQENLEAHEGFENRVGAGSWRAFRRWLASGARAALYLVPLSLLGMFLGTCLASPAKIISQGLGSGASTAGKVLSLASMSWLEVSLSYLAITALVQAALLGGVFAGGRSLLRGLGVQETTASWLAGAAALAAAVPIFLYLGYTLPLAMPVLGIQAVLLYAYARSGTLLVPLGINAILSVVSIYSARMMALIQEPADRGMDSMPGIPGVWGVLAVLGTSLALVVSSAAWRHWGKKGWGFFKAAASREWRRLEVLGRWWKKPGREGAVKSPVPILATGLVWGVGVYLASYLSYYAVHAAFPVHEVIPESLKRTLAMPFDIIVYIFLIGAAMEEWIFRKGLFDWIRAKLAALKAGTGTVFWTAALASSVAFSAIHYLDMSAALDWLNVNVSGLSNTLVGTYSFSWAGFTGRVAAGLALAGLYSRSGALMIPLAAHFASNLLEAVGLRWGLGWMLAGVAALFAFKLLSQGKKPRPAAR